MEKTSLIVALDSLKAVVELIEEAEGFDSVDEEKIMELAPQLDSSLDDLKTRVDARINFLEHCALLEKKLQNDVEYFQKKVKIIKNVQQSVKKHTLYLMENNPQIKFEGTNKKLKVCNNGGKQPMEWNVDLMDYKYVIPCTELDKFPADMIHKEIIYTLDMDKFDGFISAGGLCAGARPLPRGKHVRIV